MPYYPSDPFDIKWGEQYYQPPAGLIWEPPAMPSPAWQHPAETWRMAWEDWVTKQKESLWGFREALPGYQEDIYGGMYSQRLMSPAEAAWMNQQIIAQRGSLQDIYGQLSQQWNDLMASFDPTMSEEKRKQWETNVRNWWADQERIATSGRWLEELEAAAKQRMIDEWSRAYRYAPTPRLVSWSGMY